MGCAISGFAAAVEVWQVYCELKSMALEYYDFMRFMGTRYMPTSLFCLVLLDYVYTLACNGKFTPKTPSRFFYMTKEPEASEIRLPLFNVVVDRP